MFNYVREMDDYEAETDYREWLDALMVQRQMEDYFRDRDAFDLTECEKSGIMEA